MPIEIKELNIKAFVSDNNDRPQTNQQFNKDMDKEEIIAECIERIMQIFKEKMER